MRRSCTGRQDKLASTGLYHQQFLVPDNKLATLKTLLGAGQKIQGAGGWGGGGWAGGNGTRFLKRT